MTQVRTLLAADPENLALRYLAAGFYSEMGDTATAEQELQQILQKKPDHPPSNNDLGYLWADRGIHLGQAEQMIRGALKAEPKSPAYLDSLGWVMYKQGRFEEAVRTLQEATQLAPELDAVLWDHLGDAYWRLSRREDAAKAWEAAAKILQAQGAGAKPGVLDRVRQKMQNAGAGQSPDVAPLGAKSDAGPADAKSSAAPQP
jgi:tetratricopeptide (TPR) repeat protein